jgi:hypothetical protein
MIKIIKKFAIIFFLGVQLILENSFPIPKNHLLNLKLIFCSGVLGVLTPLTFFDLGCFTPSTEFNSITLFLCVL